MIPYVQVINFLDTTIQVLSEVSMDQSKAGQSQSGDTGRSSLAKSACYSDRLSES